MILVLTSLKITIDINILRHEKGNFFKHKQQFLTVVSTVIPKTVSIQQAFA